MQDQCFRQQDVTTLCNACFTRAGFNDAPNVVFSDPPSAVRSERKFEAPIGFVGKIKVHAREDHGFHHARWRFGVPHAGLAGPVRET